VKINVAANTSRAHCWFFLLSKIAQKTPQEIELYMSNGNIALWIASKWWDDNPRADGCGQLDCKTDGGAVSRSGLRDQWWHHWCHRYGILEQTGKLERGIQPIQIAEGYEMVTRIVVDHLEHISTKLWVKRRQYRAFGLDLHDNSFLKDVSYEAKWM
jgi:hypothetical protein